MALFSKLGWWGKKAVDQAVGVTSGTVPVPVLDSPKAFRLVVIVGVIAVGVSGWLVVNGIVSATRIPPVATSNTNTTPIAELEKLRSKDTDQDGISDYDELYALKTSPYLPDSDSDGTNDGDEIAKGQDPNCPKGKSCTNITTTSTITDASGQLTPEFLRQSLLASGVPQTTIDQLNDSDLLRIYQEATSTDTNVNATTVPTLDNLHNLSSDQIRQLMIDSGMSAEDLKDVDDAALKKIFQQALDQANSPE